MPGLAELTALRSPQKLTALRSPKNNVAFTQLVFGTAESSVAFLVPIPVLLEPTRTLFKNLLTRGTVLGQPHWRSDEAGKDSRQKSANLGLFLFL